MQSHLRTLTLGLALACVSQQAAADADLAVTLSGLDARIAASPGDPALWQRRASLERLRGDLDRAGADLSRAEALGLPRALVDRDRGLLWLAADRPAEAEAALRSARSRSPKDVTVLLAHARALTALRRWGEAADAYGALVTQAPDAGPDVHLERIRALAALGPERFDDAQRAADAAIARCGSVPALEQAAIDAALRAGRTELALARLERMAATAVRPETHLMQRAGILLGAGRSEEAASAYGAALAALESLPPHRRGTPAAAEIEAAARAGIARIAAGESPRQAASAVQESTR